MARPAGYQWEPLGWDTDPVPGDPEVISAEAAHLSSVATQITGQVAALQKIAADGVQIGQTPGVLRSSASSLGSQLTEVVGRYQQVAAALRGWVPELEQAQRMSVQALDQAEIPYRRLHQQVILPAGLGLTAAQEQEVTDYQTSMRRAQAELDAAKALLGRAIALRDTAAGQYKAKIDNASNDAMTDSWWDHFESWVSHYAGILKTVCTVLEALATALALVAIFLPGVDILVILGLGVTFLALLGRTALAATGNGSWAEVALDAFALLSFGGGKLVGHMMGTSLEAMAGTARGLVQAERDASLIGRAGTLLGRASGLLEQSPAVKSVTAGLRRLGLADLSGGLSNLAGRVSGALGRAGAAALERASPSLETTLATVSEEVKPGEVVLYGGEKESLLMTRKVAAIAARFPESGEILRLRGEFRLFLNIQRGLFTADAVTDLGDKIASNIHIPGTGPYLDLKDSLTTPGGLTTAQANDIVNTLQAVPAAGFAPAGFRAALGGGWQE